MSQFLVTGTDTGIGKTVVSAMLVAALDAHYWKPVQAGTEDGTDSDRVVELAGVARERILQEAYCLSVPASPHYAAEQDGVTLDLDKLDLPEVTGPLIVEGAGGLLVPLTRTTLQVDVFAGWDLPVILCARTALGTINHTLMSLAVLQDWEMTVHGVVFVGDAHPDNEKTIAEMSGVQALGRLPRLETLSQQALRDAFAANFRREQFT